MTNPPIESEKIWPQLSKSEVRAMLKLARERAGIRPRKQTLAEARKAGFVRGYRECLAQLVKLAGSEGEGNA